MSQWIYQTTCANMTVICLLLHCVITVLYVRDYTHQLSAEDFFALVIHHR